MGKNSGPQITLTVPLPNGMTVTVTGDDKEVIRVASFWTMIPPACLSCGASWYFTYREPQGYDYYGVRCTGDIPHSYDFHKSKNDDALEVWAKDLQKDSWQRIRRGDDPEREPEAAAKSEAPARKVALANGTIESRIVSLWETMAAQNKPSRIAENVIRNLDKQTPNQLETIFKNLSREYNERFGR